MIAARAAVVLLLSFALKQHYSTAPVADLAWILRPTTALVELLTGLPFDYEAELGFVHRPLAFAIAKPCAGVNYAITAFILLCVSRRGIFANAAIAYLSAVVMNAVRIAIAVSHASAPPQWINADTLHRLEGTVIYFVGLSVLYVCVVRRARWYVPLACYLGLTVVVPWLNGAAKDPRFFAHAALVCLVAAAIALVIGVVSGTAARARESSARRRPPLPSLESSASTASDCPRPPS
ncbi:MAG: exosortase K [Deltaproteobacteria bacterium]|nr:exosortase K [Deltaproteobacteria bacterium]